MGNILVTGGGGYIGSHAAKAVAAAGSTPVVVDTLENGHEEFVRWGPLVKANILDRSALGAVFEEFRPQAVLHFAGLIDSAESVTQPDKYFRTNVDGTRTLVESMRAHDVTNLVFSSSAAVYGNDHRAPIQEEAQVDPATPYGESKAKAEALIRELGGSFGLRWVALRYFNAAGASAEGDIGEDHQPETHAIPLAIAAAKNATPFRVFGTDYDTPDGTAVRDYIHVSDLADAHLRAMIYLDQGGDSTAFNLGTGQGASVREIVREVETESGKSLAVIEKPRRVGDAPHLVSDCSRAKNQLGWQTRHSDLANIVSSAWRWHTRPLAEAPEG